MPNFFENFHLDGRYRFRRGRSIEPHEELHPEMADQELQVSPDVPDTIEELITMQAHGKTDADPTEKPEKTAKTTTKVQKVLNLIKELVTSADEDKQIALNLVQKLEDYHDNVVNGMQEDEEAKHNQIALWAIDADRLFRCRTLLETIDLD